MRPVQILLMLLSLISAHALADTIGVMGVASFDYPQYCEGKFLENGKFMILRDQFPDKHQEVQVFDENGKFFSTQIFPPGTLECLFTPIKDGKVAILGHGDIYFLDTFTNQFTKFHLGGGYLYPVSVLKLNDNSVAVRIHHYENGKGDQRWDRIFFLKTDGTLTNTYTTQGGDVFSEDPVLVDHNSLAVGRGNGESPAAVEILTADGKNQRTINLRSVFVGKVFPMPNGTLLAQTEDPVNKDIELLTFISKDGVVQRSFQPDQSDWRVVASHMSNNRIAVRGYEHLYMLDDSGQLINSLSVPRKDVFYQPYLRVINNIAMVYWIDDRSKYSIVGYDNYAQIKFTSTIRPPSAEYTEFMEDGTLVAADAEWGNDQIRFERMNDSHAIYLDVKYSKYRSVQTYKSVAVVHAATTDNKEVFLWLRRMTP